LHNLVVNHETNLLNLISLWLDTNYQIKTKELLCFQKFYTTI
jgi:hypothetical protein